MTKITLEQCRVLQAVVDEGSFARAALTLHKSQSNISYSLAKLQDMLGVQLFQLEGRKAVLTEHGAQILKLSRQMTRAAKNLENAALHLKSNYEKSLRLAVDEIFPTQVLMTILKQFSVQNTSTKLFINHGLLSGPSEQLINGEADFAIISKIPEGYIGSKLMDIHFIPYAHQNSPLHHKCITLDDLYDERYIIAQDSGLNKKRDEGWLGSEYSWKVSTLELKIQCVVHGIGFAWLPQHIVEERSLPIYPLRMTENNVRTYPIYLVHQSLQNLGPSGTLLMELFTQHTLMTKEKAWL
ncbi:LysR family transcriptional regulator [Legionella cincinnatiensis]|uniref:Transcriptional regulator n=1 Tax=Legionella cincinnatiensis TaxID=28085 RepID=A0A378IGA3_9GAMM|nr:LysR family transcriptional regulator [Legionella cincinnatiensis]KTC92165.1 LysR family transporter transcriptional regulator [Legionella cincinnatiensis]STX33531.1 transcriptional regulator [Legionella cincinnatiensis]